MKIGLGAMHRSLSPAESAVSAATIFGLIFIRRGRHPRQRGGRNSGGTQSSTTFRFSLWGRHHDLGRTRSFCSPSRSSRPVVGSSRGTHGDAVGLGFVAAFTGIVMFAEKLGAGERRPARDALVIGAWLGYQSFFSSETQGSIRSIAWTH
jgi:hypothetical protein